MEESKEKRSYGDILLDMETLINEAIDDHDVQAGDLLYGLYGYLKIHRPDSFEVYEDDNQNPEFYYGPKRI